MTAVSARVESLTDERLLRRNVVFNLLGWALPAIAALVSIPMLAQGLGPARFGLLAIAWASVSLFSLFDFGLGRALTRLVADRLARDDVHSIGDVVWTASWLLLALTGVLTIVGVLAAPFIVERALHVPATVTKDAVAVVRLIALAIPALAHGVALRGVLEAGQRFKLVNQLRVPLGIATYAGPLIPLALGAGAAAAVAVVVVARIVYWLAHFFVLGVVAPGVGRPRGPSRAAARELLHVGGWITVSNVVSPLIVQADRVVIALLFPIAVSGWYATAAEVATKQWLFTAALQPVLFSALAAAIGTSPQRAVELMERAARVSLIALLPVALLLTAFAEPGLRLWLRSAYVPEAASVLRWLAVAVYVNAIAQVPYSVLQGGVDAKSVGLLHVAELPLYAMLLVSLARFDGATGVAVAWFIRMTVDGIAMWWLAYQKFELARPVVTRVTRLALICFAMLAVAIAWRAVARIA